MDRIHNQLIPVNCSNMTMNSVDYMLIKTLPSRARSPNACSGKMALKYVILETEIASNFLTNRTDLVSVSCSVGNTCAHCKK